MKVRELIPPPKKDPRVTRCLLLLSGGLDSILAGKVLEEQGIEVVAVVFESPFFGSTAALRAARAARWPLIAVDITEEQLRVVENPRHGYGKNMNPCIDCHAQMIRIAGSLLETYEASFVATGEVLGERPKSQNPQALRIVEEESGLVGKVLRPLSARLLPETDVEREGRVDRARLLDIQGRSRRRQFELARRYELREYPSPGGGCLLTDPRYSYRLRKVFEWRGSLRGPDAWLIRHGRLFLFPDALACLGRNKEDNDALGSLIQPGDVLAEVVEKAGPLAVVRAREDSESHTVSNETIELVSLLVARYSQAREDSRASVRVRRVTAVFASGEGSVSGEPAGPRERQEEEIATFSFERSQWEPLVDAAPPAYAHLV